jgi:outer membrane immunogenic protein
MKKVLLATTILALSAFAGNAADLPRKGAPVYKPMVSVPSFSWTGFYVGVNGGWLRQNVSGGILGSKATNGGLIGGTVGYNYQLQNNIVLGVEGDLAYASNSGTRVLNAAPLVTAKTSNDYFGTLRGRLGYSMGTFMPYLTGGAAFNSTKITYNNTLTPLANFSKTGSNAGWTIGAGVEAQLWQNVTAKVEYLYADFGKQSYAAYGKVRVTDHVVRAGLNYKF